MSRALRSLTVQAFFCLLLAGCVYWLFLAILLDSSAMLALGALGPFGLLAGLLSNCRSIVFPLLSPFGLITGPLGLM